MGKSPYGKRPIYRRHLCMCQPLCIFYDRRIDTCTSFERMEHHQQQHNIQLTKCICMRVGAQQLNVTTYNTQHQLVANKHTQIHRNQSLLRLCSLLSVHRIILTRKFYTGRIVNKRPKLKNGIFFYTRYNSVRVRFGLA